MQFTLAKKGSFYLMAAPEANPGRCGAETNRSYEYEVQIGIDGNELDDNDFVMDHLLIQKFFDDQIAKEPWILSCEMIAARAVMYFFNLLEEREPFLVEVNIVADTVNHKVRWDADMSTPRMPVVKQKFANIGAQWIAAATQAAASNEEDA